MKGLLNTPLYIPSAPSISYCANVEVPITILSGLSYVDPETKGLDTKKPRNYLIVRGLSSLFRRSSVVHSGAGGV